MTQEPYQYYGLIYLVVHYTVNKQQLWQPISFFCRHGRSQAIQCSVP